MKIKYTKAQIILEIISLAIIITTCIYTYKMWSGSPNQIPTHYSITGEADNWGNKNSILFLLALSVTIWLLLTIICRFKSIWKLPQSVEAENKEKVYLEIKNLFILLKIEIGILLLYIITRTSTLSPIFLPITITILIVTVITFAIRISMYCREYDDGDYE